MGEDNWVHRSERMSCATCMWYVQKAQSADNPVVAVAVGRCRKKSPSMDGWPVMFSSDWCGQHKLDENKVGRE